MGSDQLGLTNSSTLCSEQELFLLQQIACSVMAGRVAMHVVKNCELQLMVKGRGGAEEWCGLGIKMADGGRQVEGRRNKM
jgi:hypothetical protein